ncbi:centrosomal protein of 85 kDa-like isoform X2 [Siniperca chuatsi]|uniref:centrosomal protein of 85 kDa-like isoform X2 n=1 Tax=Siniperca chuatsi TaxID=119488 RepID=UPI001CE179A1|nr:centrosomal protein of 85 kDa-like isoform X2 [Siniperca chuatsi]
MWYRSDFEDGYESNKTGSSSGGSPGWVPGHESAWHSNPPGPGNSFCGGRRHSTVSDSGDTGIGTYCSDSVEDDSSSSTTPLSFQPLPQHHVGQDSDGIPIVQVMPSPSSSLYSSVRMPASPSSTGRWSRSCQLLTPVMAPQGASSCLDMKDHQPIRRWSSLTKLSSGVDKSSTRTSGDQYNPDSQGSLDRGLLYGYRKEPLGSNVDLYLPLSSSLLCHSLLQRSPGAGPCYRYNHSSRSAGLETDLSLSSALSSPVKHNSLDMNYSALPEAKLARGGGQVYGLSLPKQADSPLGHQTDRGSPIQPEVRTQMWLTEQMEYKPKVEHGGKLGHISGTGTEGFGGDGPSPWQQGHQQEPGLNQMLMGTSLPVNALAKVEEGLLRQRELEIDRQKQQILQLHARIRENELRAQQVLQNQRGWFDDPHILNTKESTMRTPCKQPSERLCCDEELGKKLAVAELEVLHLNEFFKQVTQKYTEDIRKLEEKIKTRDRYISSLKKKCQRESEQNQEKQQRIEILEKYLSDLPTLDEVKAQAQQVHTRCRLWLQRVCQCSLGGVSYRRLRREEVQQKAKDLENTMARLQKSLEEGCALMKEKKLKIGMQAKREKELIASVHSLQKKVQQCLDDGVRLPMQDLKRLEVENTQLLEQQDHSSRLIEHQKEQIERLTSQLTATSTRLQKKRGLSHRQQSYPLAKEASLAAPPRAFPQQRQVGDGPGGHPLSHVEVPEVGRLLKQMSLCLLDLQALCSILAQRAQGKEPNLSLLLGMKSLSVSAEESDCRVVVEEELRFKLLEVGQLRRGIDELRKSISDCYAQYMGDSCVSQ